MKLKDFMKAMQAIEQDRSLSQDIVVAALKEALAKAYRKHIEIPDALVRVDINEKSGEIKVYQQRAVVEEVEDDELEISLADAKKIRQEVELGDMIENEVSIENLGRAAVILAKNVMKQKIREAEKQAVYDEYCDKLDDLVVGTVESVEEKFCVVNIGKTLALMPRVAQIPGEHYYEGQRLRVVVSEVNKETKGAQVLVSRADGNLVKRLFEKEVPEIYQGIIEIKAIARDPGERCKMAVYSKNENIDPIGACIGPRGSCVQVIIDELHGEKIDIFEWSDDVTELIKNALAPAEILAVIPNTDRRGLLIVVNDNQLSLAIGKKGKNARLAVKLTGNKIDIKSESEVNALGIDWKAIAAEQKAKQAEKLALERAEAQQRMFEEREMGNSEIDDEYLANELQPSYEEVAADEVVSEPALEVNSEAEEAAEAEAEEVAEVKEKAEVKEERAETDLERAARIAKEKQRAEGLNIKEKQEYVSKFEQIAGAPAAKPTTAAKPRWKKESDEEEKRRKPTFDLKKDYELKPIYSEEELEEIAKREAEEKANDWINDEIDFDEFDEYYEE